MLGFLYAHSGALKLLATLDDAARLLHQARLRRPLYWMMWPLRACCLGFDSGAGKEYSARRRTALFSAEGGSHICISVILPRSRLQRQRC